MLTSTEKFLLFVSSYAAAIQCRNFRTVLSNARALPKALYEGKEETRAYDFAVWHAGDSGKPEWMPKTVDQAEALFNTSA